MRLMVVAVPQFQQVYSNNKPATCHSHNLHHDAALVEVEYPSKRGVYQHDEHWHGGRVKVVAFQPMALKQRQQRTLESTPRAIETGGIFKRTRQQQALQPRGTLDAANHQCPKLGDGYFIGAAAAVCLYRQTDFLNYRNHFVGC